MFGEILRRDCKRIWQVGDAGGTSAAPIAVANIVYGDHPAWGLGKDDPNRKQAELSAPFKYSLQNIINREDYLLLSHIHQRLTEPTAH